MIGYIYLIRNVVNHKCYVGQTKSPPQERWSEHIKSSKSDVGIKLFWRNKFLIIFETFFSSKPYNI